MRRILLTALVLGLAVGLPARLFAQDDPKEIIKKAIAAHGGADKIDKFKGSKTTAKGMLSILGMDIEFTSDTLYQDPDKLKQTIKFEINGMAMSVEQKVVGDKVSMSLNGMTQELPDTMKGEVKNAVTTQQILNLTPLLRDKAYELKALGESKIDGKDLVGVSISNKDIKDFKVYFDKASSLITRIERTGTDPMGAGEVKYEITVSDYKDVQGLKRPTKTVVTMDGKKYMETTTKEQKLLEKVDDKEFSD
jgi:hypothetical protein